MRIFEIRRIGFQFHQSECMQAFVCTSRTNYNFCTMYRMCCQNVSGVVCGVFSLRGK